MSDKVIALHGVRILACDPDGPMVRGGADAADLISAAWSAEAQLVAVPLGRLGAAFLDLKTGLAGEITQKFVNYGLRLAVVGGIDAAEAAGPALRDYVRECNRGQHVWFVADIIALSARLKARSL